MDVTQPESVEQAFAQVKARGALDVLVNNAGIGVFTPFWERDYAEFMQVMSVNAGGTFLCTREALRLMKDQGPGRHHQYRLGLRCGQQRPAHLHRLCPHEFRGLQRLQGRRDPDDQVLRGPCRAAGACASTA
jgi:NAD(P)-dependent dehydrogenase (short-subunit alcohol dehydrogenase family)